MFCRFCGVTLPDNSRFCSQCGKSLADGAPAPPAEAGAPPPLPPALKAGGARPAGPPPLEAESELWAGAISPRSMVGTFALAGLWAVAVVAAMLFARQLRVAPGIYFSIGAAVLPLGYVYFVWLWETMRVRYRLTTARLFRREGVLFRRSTELELFRVDDVTVEQTLFDRIFSTGTVVVNSTDASDPVVRLEGIDRPHDVKEKIRTAVLQRRRGVAYVERL